MKTKRTTPVLAIGLAVATALGAGIASPASAHPGHDAEPEFRALVFSETAGFVHDSVAEAKAMWDEVAAANHFEVVQATDSALFTEEGLADFDVIVLAQASGDVWNSAEEDAFESYVRGGGGVVAMHNPLDMEQGNTFYRSLIGTEFTAHSAANTPGVLDVVDHDHPSTAELPHSITRNEEWYGFTKSVRGDKHVLTELDPTSVPGNTAGRMLDHPVTWCAPYEGGRTWITSIGHSKSSYSEPLVRQHVLGGIRYAAGVAEGDCTATDWNNFDKVPLDTDTSAPWGIAVAPDGRVFFTELVRGQVRIYDPELQSTVTAATIPVYGDGENGLTGLALDPDFASNGWVYVYYSPTGDEHVNRLSRFTMDGNTMQLDTEKVMLEVPATRVAGEIGHTGGTLRIDGQGDLWLSVGDDVVPFESSGYTPIDERPGRAHFDAQGTSANSNDLRGKLLRIHPEDDGTYSIPEGNMFAPGTEKTRPEIFAMGFRNPFRFSVDPSGTVYLADYGPDAGSANPNRGPAGYVEWQVIREPGNYGWPYCHANNIAYNDFNFATNTSGAKFDCANPVNDSPNNTGLTQLPASIPAEVYYSYGASAEFPQLGSGSGSPMAGPVYQYDEALESDRKWPKYFDGTPLFYEWGRNYIKEFQLDGDGRLKAINPVLNNLQFLSPLDLQFGPDGALYLLEWGGGFGRDNPNSGLYRIDYSSTGRAPTASASADVTSGGAPLTVEFSSEGTVDKDGDEFEFLWEFGDGTTSTEADPTHVYEENGNYEARLTVTELTDYAKTGTATVSIVVGNTAPGVKITEPSNGGFFSWGDTLPWKVEVTDPEDGEIDCGDVAVQPALGHDDHAHPVDAVHACEGETLTILDEGHAEADAFWAIDARYTDKGGAGGIQALTLSDTNVYRAKRFQAHYYDEAEGLAVESNAAAEYGQYVGAIQNDDWLRYDDMNFQGIDAVRYRVSAGPEGGGTIEMRLGSPTGELVASTPVASTGGWFTFKETAPTPITAPEGTHDVYLVFKSNPGVNWSMTLDVFEAVGDGVGTPPPGTPRIDTTTQGDWIGRYGELGYAIPNIGTQLPDGVTVAPAAGTSSWTFEQTSTDKAALQVPPDGTARRASTWFAGTAQVNVGVPEGKAYELSVYVNSFDGTRQESITLQRPDGTPIGPVQTVSDNKRGVWLTYQVVGSVEVKAARITGPNAVIGGIFLDPADAPTDEVAPTVSATTGPAEPGESGWYTEGDVRVELAATDGDGSGIESIEVAIGDGAWAAYLGTVVVADEGETLVRYRATDRSGNVSEIGELTVRVDRTAPTATATTVEAPSDSGWHTQGVELTIDGEDTGGSGVGTLRYSIGEGGWITYTDPVRISSEGPNLVRYQVIDVAGNESPVGEVSIQIDSDAPTLELSVSPKPSGGKVKGKATVTVDSADTGSGVAAVQYSIDGSAWTNYPAPLQLDEKGTWTVRARATDVAGNTSEIEAVTVRIVGRTNG
ncbi:ThuA domain-containing protein [Agromyces sp. SYSU K20354]|uniref:ThuA domain-containing protein n=1 Tax=Agromyces cavernae TaxID=2898659 RepID=UPI001E4644C6|nr:ThuA domain-containing protein [Agromyces cavernae]MCD2443240.1 ThuA domain-containing protein [Agromyces cavernae]